MIWLSESDVPVKPLPELLKLMDIRTTGKDGIPGKVSLFNFVSPNWGKTNAQGTYWSRSLANSMATLDHKVYMPGNPFKSIGACDYAGFKHNKGKDKLSENGCEVIDNLPYGEEVFTYPPTKKVNMNYLGGMDELMMAWLLKYLNRDVKKPEDAVEEARQNWLSFDCWDISALELQVYPGVKSWDRQWAAVGGWTKGDT